MLADAGALKGWLEQQAAREDLEAIVVAHGPPLTDCRSALTDAAARL